MYLWGLLLIDFHNGVAMARSMGVLSSLPLSPISNSPYPIPPFQFPMHGSLSISDTSGELFPPIPPSLHRLLLLHLHIWISFFHSPKSTHFGSILPTQFLLSRLPKRFRQRIQFRVGWGECRVDSLISRCEGVRRK